MPKITVRTPNKETLEFIGEFRPIIQGGTYFPILLSYRDSRAIILDQRAIITSDGKFAFSPRLVLPHLTPPNLQWMCEHPEWDADTKREFIIGCQPVDCSVIPEGITSETDVRLTPGFPLYAGSIKAKCTECKCDIFMGPRQKQAFDMAPDIYMVLCWVCAADRAKLVGGCAITHLGNTDPQDLDPQRN